MKYHSWQDIEEMKKTGADAAEIEKAERSRAWSDELIAEIRAVFADVKLGKGVGLFEGQGLDDWAGEAECARIREKDEKDDWQLIAVPDLNTCHTSLSFFDPAGMRFHLPAFMIAELRGKFHHELIFHLTDRSEYSLERLSAFQPAERRVVRRFLERLSEDEEYEFQRAGIEKALEEYWKD